MPNTWTKEQHKKYQETYFPNHYQNNKEYYLEKAKKYKKVLRKWLAEYKLLLKCSSCPENHPSCLEFHHLEPTKKEINVSEAVSRGWSEKRILKEIDKCVVLCSNCHKKLHWDNIQQQE